MADEAPEHSPWTLREQLLGLGWIAAGLIAVSGYLYVDQLRRDNEALRMRLESLSDEVGIPAPATLMRERIEEAVRTQERKASSGRSSSPAPINPSLPEHDGATQDTQGENDEPE